MAMTLSELRTEVRGEVRDPSGNRFTNTTVRRQLNQGQLELARLSHRLVEWNTAVAAGAASVDFPTDMLYLREAAWEVPGSERYSLNVKYGLPRIQPGQTGDPVDVWSVNDHFILDPLPASAGTFIIAGIERPTALSADTDYLDLDDADEPVIAYAVWALLDSEQNPAAPLARARWERLRDDWVLADAQHHPMQRVMERRPWWW